MTITAANGRHVDRATDETTSSVVAGWSAVAALIARHNLHAQGVDVHVPSTSGTRYSFEADGPQHRRSWDAMVPTTVGVRVDLLGSPVEFLHWCEALTAPRVRVCTNHGTALLRAEVHRHGYRWAMHSSVSAAATGAAFPAQVAWERTDAGRRKNEGWTAVADLRNALAVLGCRQVDATGDMTAVAPYGPVPATIVEWADPSLLRGCGRCGSTAVRLAVFNTGAEVCVECGRGAR